MALVKEGGVDYPKDAKTLIRDYGEQAIQCCIGEWNKLCPQYSLTNVTEVKHQKRRLFHTHDVAVLEEGGGPGQISRVAFEVNEHLTAKALRKHPDTPMIVLDCSIWWDWGTSQVHGWSSHIAVDVTKGHVTEFPEITPAAPHFYCCPLP